MRKSVFIWDSVFPVNNREHASGGVVIVAESVEAARVLYRSKEGENGAFLAFTGYVEGTSGMTLTDCELLSTPPDHIYVLATLPSDVVMVFPDAGCC